MSQSSRRRALTGAVLAVSFASPALGNAFFASEVVQYNAGTDPNNFWMNSSSALDKPAADTGFGMLTPFNGAYDASHITGVGAGGSLTLKLPQTAATFGYSLGVHAAVGLNDTDWPNGNPGAAATPYTNRRAANVQVSLDGTNWVDLGNKIFTIPTNFYSEGVTTPGYQPTPGTTEADWAKPFTQPLSSFDNKTWPQILTTLNGSAGGEWINPSAPSLAGINYVRFNVPAGTPYPMIVDAVVGNTDNQTNTGTRNLSSSPIVEAPGGTIFTNRGTLTHTGAVTVMGSNPEPGSAILNYGQLRAFTGPTVTYNVPVYNEGGSLAAAEGILQFNGRFITSGTTTKTGVATVVINGPQYHAPGATFLANQGTTKFQTDAVGLAITASAKVELNSQQHLAALQVNSTGSVTSASGGTQTLYTNALSIAPGGKLDLNDNDLVVENGNFSTLQAQVLQGYSNVPDTTKTGIISSTSQASAGKTLLVLFKNTLINSPDFPFASGQTIGTNAVAGKYTYVGDADFDGQVTSADYTAIDANLGATGIDLGQSWFKGDMDRDGNITSADYTGIDANLSNGIGNPLSAAAPVPEPATLSLLAVFGAGLLARRRTRHPIDPTRARISATVSKSPHPAAATST
jgi:hypothetical protein